jgi:hypothetical protein
MCGNPHGGGFLAKYRIFATFAARNNKIATISFKPKYKNTER